MKWLDFIHNMYTPKPLPPQPKYRCEKHGEVPRFGLSFGGGSSWFCGRCLNEFLEREFPITEIKE